MAMVQPRAYGGHGADGDSTAQQTRELLAGVAVTGLGAVLLFVLAPRKETALAAS